MAKLRQLQKSQIDIDDLLLLIQESTMSRINCHNIGRITEFDADTQTCTVELMQLKQFQDEVFSPAPLTEVPLLVYGTNNGNITLGDVVGTICVVLFFDRDIDNFIATGEQYAPETGRMHDFTDCVAFTTFSTLNNPIENYDSDSISINYQTIISTILYQAFIKNYGNKITLNVKDEDETSQSTVNLENNAISLAVEKDIGGVQTSAQIEIDDLINIQNTTQNLLLLVTELINTIKAITITGSAISQTSKDALDVVTTHFGELLR